MRWRNAGRTSSPVGANQSFSVDLTGVTSIDAAGKALLATMADRGANLLAADCLIRSIVDEITRAAFPDHSNPRSPR
jgi:ABC-type transporter Mla MlaB component